MLSVRLVTGLCVVAALLAFLGRLKLLYYFRAFGVELGLVELGLAEQLFESWFVAQSLLFVLLLWWVALKTRAIWVAGLAVAHALIPIAAHYAFVAHEAPWARVVIDYRHTLMKLLPFVALALVWLVRPGRRQELRSSRPPLGRAGMFLFGILALSWSISTAKHSGSFDANLVLREPASHLPHVRFTPAAAASIALPADGCFLLHAGRESLVVWDSAAFAGGPGEIRTLIVPRSAVESIDTRRRFQVQPGNQFF